MVLHRNKEQGKDYNPTKEKKDKKEEVAAWGYFVLSYTNCYSETWINVKTISFKAIGKEKKHPKNAYTV
jgi:hypothetical protein